MPQTNIPKSLRNRTTDLPFRKVRKPQLKPPLPKRDPLSSHYQSLPFEDFIERFEPTAGVRVIMDPYGRIENPNLPESHLKMTKSTFQRK